MKRTKKVKQQVSEIIDRKRKPSASLIAEQLDWPEQDVHRCLNSLEKKGEVKTYVKEILGRKNRFVSLKR